jgi:NAD+ diphosphatase
MELNFCRRCGSPLKPLNDTEYKCQKGHTIFANSSPAVGMFLVDEQQRLLLGIRARDPGKGLLDMPGGFCNFNESLEQAIARELMEELDLLVSDYSAPVYLLSHAEPYRFGGEATTVLGAIYWARLREGAEVTAGDDVADTVLLKASEIDLDQLSSEAMRLGLRRLQELKIIGPSS